MRYVSARGRTPELGFCDVLLAGLATDGGLYLPTEWPTLPVVAPQATYAQLAAAVIAPFVGGEIDDATLLRMCEDTYGTFRHPAVVPLVQIDDQHFLQELFHGPTLAFKDLALQLVGRLFDHVLTTRSERIMIVGATSGDTGSAAIDAIKGCANVDIVVLYPHGRTSEVQRRQMTTVDAPNVRTVAIAGTFDDCQDLVKAMFNDAPFREQMSLAAVNSINWARVMSQVVYYVAATRILRGRITFCVPTGNFGNVLSGWIAKRMGAPIDRLVVASNTNDIVTRFINSGEMSTADVVPTLSPSMDIQVSSNFERLLFEMNDRDGGMTTEQLERFRATGRLQVEDDQRRAILDGTFLAARVDDEGTLDVIARTHRDAEVLVDPHTAVGIGAAQTLQRAGRLCGRVVTLATAHPAKFPDAVERATGIRPALPSHLADLFDRPETIAVLPNDLGEVQRFVAGDRH